MKPDEVNSPKQIKTAARRWSPDVGLLRSECQTPLLLTDALDLTHYPITMRFDCCFSWSSPVSGDKRLAAVLILVRVVNE